MGVVGARGGDARFPAGSAPSPNGWQRLPHIGSACHRSRSTRPSAARRATECSTPNPTASGPRERLRTLAEVKAWQHQMEVSKRAGTFVPVSAARIQFQQLLDRHLELTAGLSENTLYQRRSVARKWLTPKWETWPVADITRNLVELWIEELNADGVGSGTIQKVYRLFNATLNHAVEDHLLQRNPARGVRLPRARPAQRHPYLTFDELAELNDAMGFRYRSLVTFLALTGLRFGEAAALRVSSIDLDGRLVHIDSAFKEVAGRLSEGDTKSHTIHTIAYPPILDAMMRELTSGRRGEDHIFRSPTSRGLRINTWRRRFWYPAIERITTRRAAESARTGQVPISFPDVTPHDLQHTAASLAIRAGAEVVAVARMLGHADSRMPLNTYAGLFTGDLTAVAETLQRDMSGSALDHALRSADLDRGFSPSPPSSPLPIAN